MPEIERRGFFKFLGGGLVLLLALDNSGSAQESRGDARPPELAAWLHIAEDGAITVYTGKTEVGQNIRTSLAQAVAEELRTTIQSIHLVMADTDLTPYDMGTFGSRTTPLMAPQMKKVGAAAREALIELAAEKWKIERSSITVAAGAVKNNATGEAVGFGALTRGQKLLRNVGGAESSVTPASEWKIEGTSAAKVNALDMVTGAHRYTSDIARPGMLYGRVLRLPAFNAKLASFDAKEAGAIPDILVMRDGDFAGAVASDELTLDKAIRAIQAEWTPAPQPPSNKELFEYLKKNVAPQRSSEPGNVRAHGDINEALQAAAHKLDATYTVAYIAHVPLEPRAAVAEWSSGKLTVWTGTQRPFSVKSELAEAFKIPEERVRVIVPDTGSAYGGKHTGEAAIEAARLAKAAGRPVKLIWSREEEFTWAYFRPAGVIEIRSGVSSDGLISAWDFHNYNSGSFGIETPYDIVHRISQFHATESPLRQGSYRGLAATANHFARESHMDDLAAAVGMDPLEFRLKNLKNDRLRAVLEAATEKFGWATAKNEPRSATPQGFGLACGVEKGGYVATCAEISIVPPDFLGAEVTPGPPKVKIERVVTAFECGAIVNPEHLKNQIEGSIMMGIGGALFEAVEFSNGRILNSRLSKYRVPRFSDVPVIETVLVDRKDLPSAGAGETPIVGLAPAVGNAIFHATGTRLRSLPMTPRGFVQPL